MPSLLGPTTTPRCGGNSPVSSFMNVDLPAPFGPVRPYRRPDEKVVVTSSKRTFDPNRIDTPWTEIIKGTNYYTAIDSHPAAIPCRSVRRGRAVARRRAFRVRAHRVTRGLEWQHLHG